MKTRAIATTIALSLANITACQAPSYTTAELKERGTTMDGRIIGLEGEIVHPEVPRTRRAIRLEGKKDALRAFELRDRGGRVVVWYEPSRLDAPLTRGARVTVTAQVSFPGANGGSGGSAEMVLVATRVHVLE